MKNNTYFIDVLVGIIALFALSFIFMVLCRDMESFIYDSNGHTWEATSENIITAFDALTENTELWLPPGDYEINRTLYIDDNGVKIHGNNTNLFFTEGDGIRSSANARSDSYDTRLSVGLNNILLEDFNFRGNGNLEIVLGNNTVIKNVHASYIVNASSGTFRLVLPTTSPSPVSNLTVTGCSTYRTYGRGIVIYSAIEGTYTIQNVLIENCTAQWAGCYETSENKWYTGIDICENWDYSVLTISDVTVKNCTAEYCWESGFHMQDAPIKINVLFENCKSNYNGQKRNYYPNPPWFYCSGFLSTYGQNQVVIKDCEANYNTHYGFYVTSTTTLINPQGVGNWDGLYP